MRIVDNPNLSFQEKREAMIYLMDIYGGDSFSIVRKIPEQIDNLPTKETRDNDIKSIQKERDNLYNELNPKKSKSVKIETKPSKPINPKKI